MLNKLFENWEKEILRPIVVSLVTALLLFSASLMFAPVRTFFFPPEGISDYPIFCIAEPYKSSTGTELMVDFFIINRTDDDYSREKLVSFLKARQPHPDESLSPDINLPYVRGLGRIRSAAQDKDFNDSKGELKVDARSDGVIIRIDSIAARAVMKVSVVIADLPELPHLNITRRDRAHIPLDYEEYQKACYSR